MTDRPTRVRINPRDRRGVDADQSAMRPRAAHHQPTVRNHPDRHVFVVLAGPIFPADSPSRLMGLARKLATNSGAVWIISSELDMNFAAMGADRTIQSAAFGNDELDCGQIIAVLTSLYDKYEPAYILFVDSVIGREIASRLAVHKNLPMALNATRFDGDTVLTYAQGSEYAHSGAKVVVVEPAYFPIPDAVDYGEARPVEIAVLSPHSLNMASTAIKREPAKDMPLEEAPLVVAVGLGVRAIPAAQHVAEKLGAAFGASRPVCDAGLVERGRQIGASGRQVAPDIYIALGISGAPQHMDGITSAGKIIAVNVDTNAPIMARAALPLRTDADQTLDALMKALQGTV